MAAKSAIWKFFSKNKKLRVNTCNLCGNSQTDKGNTTNMWAHLKNKHPSVYSVAGKEKMGENKSKKRRTHSPSSEKENPDDPDVSEVLPSVRKKTNNAANDIFLRSKNIQQSSRHTTEIILENNVEEEIIPTHADENCNEVHESIEMQNTIDGLYKKLASYEEGGEAHSKITNAVIYMICVDNDPFCKTEKKGFKHLMKVVAPRFKLFGRKKVVELMEKKYLSLSDVLKKEMKVAPNIAITADLWTEDKNTQPFLGITAHYINNKKLKSVNLGIFEFNERHTDENIASMVEKILHEWDITLNKVVGAVTDGAANIVSAAKILFGDRKFLYCVGHIINRIVVCSLLNKAEVLKQRPNTNIAELESFDDEGLYIDKIVSKEHGTFQKIVVKVKKIIKWFHTSNLGADDLRQVSHLTLIQSCPTRWNSLFYMLKRYLELSDKVTSILMKYPKAPTMVTPQELGLIKDVLPILEIFEDATKQVSGEHYVTGSSIISVVDFICTQLGQIMPVTEEGEKLKESFDLEVKERFKHLETNFILSIATILDPRFKMVFFQNTIHASQAVSRVKNEMKKVGADNESSKRQNQEKERTNAKLKDVEENSYYAFAVRKAEMSQNEKTVTDDNELNNYLRIPLIPMTSNPLSFWDLHKNTYPRLYKLAMKYLIVPATSTPSERQFSRAGIIMTDRRNRMTPTHLNQLVFLSSLDEEDWHLEA